MRENYNYSNGPLASIQTVYFSKTLNKKYNA